jgi:hypothetical protein
LAAYREIVVDQQADLVQIIQHPPTPTEVTQDPFGFLRKVFTVCAAIVRRGASTQEPQRRELAVELQTICSDCADTYHKFLSDISPIKDAYANPPRLAEEVRNFAEKPEYRDSFKPDHLCGNVELLLTRLGSNLDPLKYSIAINAIGVLKSSLINFRQLDGAFYQIFDESARSLSRLATDLQVDLASSAPESKVKQTVAQIRKGIESMEDEVAATLRKVHETSTAVTY